MPASQDTWQIAQDGNCLANHGGQGCSRCAVSQYQHKQDIEADISKVACNRTKTGYLLIVIITQLVIENIRHIKKRCG